MDTKCACVPHRIIIFDPRGFIYMAQGKMELEELNEVGELRKILENYPVSDFIFIHLSLMIILSTALRDC